MAREQGMAEGRLWPVVIAGGLGPCRPWWVPPSGLVLCFRAAGGVHCRGCARRIPEVRPSRGWRLPESQRPSSPPRAGAGSTPVQLLRVGCVPRLDGSVVRWIAVGLSSSLWMPASAQHFKRSRLVCRACGCQPAPRSRRVWTELSWPSNGWLGLPCCRRRFGPSWGV